MKSKSKKSPKKSPKKSDWAKLFTKVPHAADGTVVPDTGTTGVSADAGNVPSGGSFWSGQTAQTYNPNSSLAQAATHENTYGANANLQDLASSAQNRTAPTATAAQTAPASQSTAAQLNTTNYNQDRGAQQGLASSLQATANGNGPSAAADAATAQRQQGLANAAALNAGRRGGSSVAGAKMGALSSQMANQQASQNQAIGQAGEMATANGQLASTLGNLANQDTGVASNNASLQQQSGLANQAATNQTNQYNTTNQQNANLANQTAQLNQTNLNQTAALNANQQLMGQGANEMQGEQQNNQLAYSNLQPGQPGFLQSGLSSVLGALAHGGVRMAGIPHLKDGKALNGPQPALVGEAGPEAIVPLKNIVNHPQVMTLGKTPEAVIPLSSGHQADRDRVTGMALHLRNMAQPPMPRNDSGGVYTNGQLPGTIGMGQRVTPNWSVGTAGALGSELGNFTGKLAGNFLGGEVAQKLNKSGQSSGGGGSGSSTDAADANAVGDGADGMPELADLASMAFKHGGTFGLFKGSRKGRK